MNHDGSKSNLFYEYMHHDGAFCLPSGKHFDCGLCPKHMVEDAKSVRSRRASQSPRGIFQLAESVIVGNTLPAEVPVPRTSFMKRGDVISPKLIVQS